MNRHSLIDCVDLSSPLVEKQQTDYYCFKQLFSEMCLAGGMSGPKKCNSEFTKLSFSWRAKKINTYTETCKQINALIHHSKCRPESG